MERLEPRLLFAAPVDPVLEWNQVLIDTLRADRVYAGPGFSSLHAAMMHTAVYDAVMAIDGGHASYLGGVQADKHTDRTAAVAAAGWRVLTELYPAQKPMLDAALATSLSRVRDGEAEDNGVALGTAVADDMVANRAGDHAGDFVPYTPGTDAGDWQPTPPDFTPSWGAGWGAVAPMAMELASQFRPPPPPALTSAEYAAAYEQVKSLGAKNSSTRTPEQTQIGYFWAYDIAETGTPPVLYNQIVEVIAKQQHNSVDENARLFALANMAMADAGIAAWDVKFADNLWRPITAIRFGDTDGNPLTIGEPTWEPLGAPGGANPNFTPPFPAYVSGHATFGAAVCELLKNFYGTDKIHFTLRSDELPGVTRSFDSFTQAAEENGISRIYLGIHWIFDSAQGQALGRKVADFVFSHEMLPTKHGGDHDEYLIAAPPVKFIALPADHAAVSVLDVDKDVLA